MPVPDFSPGEVLTAAAMDSIGLWKIASGTLSLSTTPTNVTGVFSSAYKNYRVLLNITARSASNRFDWKYLVGTTPNSASYFASGIGAQYATDATLYFQRSNNDPVFYFDTNVARTSYILDIFLPNANSVTYHTGQTQNNSAFAFHIGGGHYQVLQNTGFQLIASTGTITMEYQVFGYRD